MISYQESESSKRPKQDHELRAPSASDSERHARAAKGLTSKRIKEDKNPISVEYSFIAVPGDVKLAIRHKATANLTHRKPIQRDCAIIATGAGSCSRYTGG